MEKVKQFGRCENTEWSVWHDSLNDRMLTLSGRLADTSMAFHFEDGTAWFYSFQDKRNLLWETSDGRKGEEIYNTSPAPGYENFLFLHHYCPQEMSGYADLLIDFDTGYAVLFDASLVQPANPREIVRAIRFGAIERYPVNLQAEKRICLFIVLNFCYIMTLSV